MKCQWPLHRSPGLLDDTELYGDVWKCGRPVECARGSYCEEHAGRAYAEPWTGPSWRDRESP